MPTILSFASNVQKQIKRYNLQKKFIKQCKFFIDNPLHPSLHLELLEPPNRSVYSFRIDRKYRALCQFDKTKQTVEILSITVHYH